MNPNTTEYAARAMASFIGWTTPKYSRLLSSAFSKVDTRHAPGSMLCMNGTKQAAKQWVPGFDRLS